MLQFCTGEMPTISAGRKLSKNFALQKKQILAETAGDMTAFETVNQQEVSSGCERSVYRFFSKRCGVMTFSVSAHLAKHSRESYSFDSHVKTLAMTIEQKESTTKPS